MKVRSAESGRYNYDLMDALDVYNMVAACTLTIRAALYRQESRGPFLRTDFPYEDNDNWLKYVLVTGPNVETARLRTISVTGAGLSTGRVGYFDSFVQ
jgi:succinate dehydrogenase/fumarate reductase flavoprotein subunit